MSTQLKHTTAAMIILSLMISSCTTTHFSTKTSEVPNSRKLLGSQYTCTVHEQPSTWDTELTVSFEKVNQYAVIEQRKKYRESDNSETRVAGLATILTGAVIGGLVALGGEDDDGNYIEPNPEAGRGIFIGGLVLGGILSIIPDSKTMVSSTRSNLTIEEDEPIQVQDSAYTIWSSIYPEKVISRTLEDDEINLDVVTDLGLDYVESTDSIQVYFKSKFDENLIYTVDFLASDYLTQYLNTNKVSDSIPLYQAPNINAPIVGQLIKGEEVKLKEKQEAWYKVEWMDRKVYLEAKSIDYFFATQ